MARYTHSATDYEYLSFEKESCGPKNPLTTEIGSLRCGITKQAAHIVPVTVHAHGSDWPESQILIDQALFNAGGLCSRLETWPLMRRHVLYFDSDRVALGSTFEQVVSIKELGRCLVCRRLGWDYCISHLSIGAGFRKTMKDSVHDMHDWLSKKY